MNKNLLPRELRSAMVLLRVTESNSDAFGKYVDTEEKRMNMLEDLQHGLDIVRYKEASARCLTYSHPTFLD